MCAGVALVAPTKHLFFACLSCLFLSFLFGWLLQMFSHHASFVSFFSLWTQCTTSCGPGYQMRAVKCVVGSYGAVMDDTECNAATRPTDTQVRGLIVLSFSPQSAYHLLTLRAFFLLRGWVWRKKMHACTENVHKKPGISFPPGLNKSCPACSKCRGKFTSLTIPP